MWSANPTKTGPSRKSRGAWIVFPPRRPKRVAAMRTIQRHGGSHFCRFRDCATSKGERIGIATRAVAPIAWRTSSPNRRKPANSRILQYDERFILELILEKPLRASSKSRSHRRSIPARRESTPIAPVRACRGQKLLMEFGNFWRFVEALCVLRQWRKQIFGRCAAKS